MTKSRLEQIRDCIRRRHYDMSAHAVEEMAEDDLDIFDIEAAALSGTISRLEKDDPRGTKYVLLGFAADRKTAVGVVGRFADESRFLIITVYVAS
ncbi:MAG TPA: DUF4258 domain-containing protein [Thermoanaerobaculia bacterium]